MAIRTPTPNRKGPQVNSSHAEAHRDRAGPDPHSHAAGFARAGAGRGRSGGSRGAITVQ